MIRAFASEYLLQIANFVRCSAKMGVLGWDGEAGDKSMNPEANIVSINGVINGWQKAIDDQIITDTKTFGGMTLAQFKTQVQPSFDTRAVLANLDLSTTNALNGRNGADAISMPLVQKVVKGVVGDTDFGDDSNLYEDMGYIRKSERQTGLTRKSTKAKTP